MADYHINADEPSVLDYNTDFKTANLINTLYAPDQFRISDHDPVIVGLNPNAAPTVDAGGPYSVNEGGSVTLTASGSDPNGDSLTYAWDLDNNGSFETSGQSASFGAAALDGPATFTVKARATDPGGLSAIAAGTVNVLNAAPTVAPPAVSAEPSTEGQSVTASATFSDPAPNDTPFTCTVAYGDGSLPLAGTVTGMTCTGPAHIYAAYGTYQVTVTVTDKDGGVGSASSPHKVIYAFSGFFSPVDNPPALNTMKAGAAVPVRFSLGGDRGLAVFAAGYPTSERIACASSFPLDPVEETTTAGASSLAYDAVTGQYRYTWKTDKAWANSCRQLVVRLADGTDHTALFRFTR